MKTQRSTNRSGGFALIATLMIITVLVIIITAFTIAMRSERAASHNFFERERAQAIANGMMHRILADQAQPFLVQTGTYLGPYQVNPTTELPLASSSSTYLANPANASNLTTLQQIFMMPPSSQVATTGSLPANHLVLLSGTSQGEPNPSQWAYIPQYWAYERQQGDSIYYPQDSQGNYTAPAWVNYEDSSGRTIGQVAYCVWDDGGKYDINMAGPDGLQTGPNGLVTNGTSIIAGQVNGLAPYDLGFEYLATNPSNLLEFLNGINGVRDRSNFSQRSLATGGPESTGVGDDREFFSIEDLVQGGFLSYQNALDVTTESRDFEIRPEWDGDRAVLNNGQGGAASYLKAYINEPAIYQLFYNAETPVNTNNIQGGPELVYNLSKGDPRDASGFSTALGQAGVKGAAITNQWLDVMTLLSQLRYALPPSKVTGTQGGGNMELPVQSTLASSSTWSDTDVYAIAMNIIQATDPPSDHQLVAYDAQLYAPITVHDALVRFGTRISPYVVEADMSATRMSGTSVQCTEYMKIWNPYPVDLSTLTYVYGDSWSGGSWPNGPGTAPLVQAGMYSNGDTDVNGDNLNGGPPFTVTGKFKANSFTVLTINSSPIALGSGHDLTMKCDPWIYNQQYYSSHIINIAGAGSTQQESIAFALSGGPFSALENTAESGGNPTSYVDMCMYYYFPASQLNNIGKKLWYSFQIDDPRMGQLQRYNTSSMTCNTTTNTASLTAAATTPENPNYQNLPTGVEAQGNSSPNVTPMWYSWKGYSGVTSLYDSNNPSNVPTGANAQFSPYVGGAKGYNLNFGENFPSSWTANGLKGAQLINRALATFALPGTPFTNLGQMATVYADRPWQTLSMSSTNGHFANFLDTYTTVGTATDPQFQTDDNLNYAQAGPQPSTVLSSNSTARLQDYIWFFDGVSGRSGSAGTVGFTQGAPGGNLRPIRGRINLNTASEDTLVRLISGESINPTSNDVADPYQLVASAGNGANYSTLNSPQFPVSVTITPAIAKELADDIIAIRPLRNMSDLVWGGPQGRGLYSTMGNDGRPLSGAFYNLQNLPQPVSQGGCLSADGHYIGYVTDAILSRLAQFGTVRQQRYTVDIVARAVKTTRTGTVVPTAEVRMLAHVYFDTFTRHAFVESVEYR